MISFRMSGNASNLPANMKKLENKMALARRLAANRVADRIMSEGRKDIRSAGRFGPRWTQGWTARLTGGRNLGDRMVIETFFSNPTYGHIFEFGGVIKAKNPTGLLFFKPSIEWATQYAATHGLSKPPQLIAVKQVFEPKKFHLRAIGTKQASQFKSYFQGFMK